MGSGFPEAEKELIALCKKRIISLCSSSPNISTFADSLKYHFITLDYIAGVIYDIRSIACQVDIPSLVYPSVELHLYFSYYHRERISYEIEHSSLMQYLVIPDTRLKPSLADERRNRDKYYNTIWENHMMDHDPRWGRKTPNIEEREFCMDMDELRAVKELIFGDKLGDLSLLRAFWLLMGCFSIYEHDYTSPAPPSPIEAVSLRKEWLPYNARRIAGESTEEDAGYETEDPEEASEKFISQMGEDD
ncbi:hypothetical protein HK098_004869 [Nowakowskiella sp. JEL0407]|nr:hypothetical protein HK098_004869 [Nowakowskiella sp. JEL0407]